MKTFKKPISFSYLLSGVVGFCCIGLSNCNAIDPKDSAISEDYNKFGYNAYGFDMEGYTQRGFNRYGIHKITDARISDLGYDMDGYNEMGAYSSEFGFFVTDEGFFSRVKRYNSRGFNFLRKHKLTGTEYDLEGYNAEGFNEHGIHRDTGDKWSPGGFDVHGVHREGYFVSQYHKMRFKQR
jgi:hypothetical protein